MNDIFLSYASEDRPRIKPLVEALKHLGLTVWWDRTIPAGKIWEREIGAALTSARCVIVLWSRTSINSDWVWAEADEGKRRDILVPVLLDQVIIPLAFRRIQAANLVNWQGDTQDSEFVELTRAVAALLGTTAPPAGTTAPPVPVPPPQRNLALFAWGFGGLVSLSLIWGLWMFLIKPSIVKPLIQVPQKCAPGLAKLNPKDKLCYSWIPPGNFQMGCSPGDTECNKDEKPAHEVTISSGFWIGQTEVTQGAYQSVTGKSNPSHFKGATLPIETVDWQQAKSYCEAVGLRLPSEAEWEYAARAGTPTARYGALDRVAWYDKNSGSKVHPVAQMSSNAWGLYDTLGNVWEWVDDSYRNGTHKVMRGGAWNKGSGVARVSYRGAGDPTTKDDETGFRCAGSGALP